MTRFFLILFLFTIPLSGQKNRNDITLGSWVIVSGTNRLSKRWSIPTVGILRHYDIFKSYELSFFRSGFTYAVNPKLDVTLGYGYLDSDSYINYKPGTRQHWLYQEFYIKSHANGFPVSHRYRWETRWIEKANNQEVNHRIRYRLRWIQSLNSYFYTNLFNEIFLSLQDPVFNQNRFHAGVGYVFSKNLKLEMGYLKNHFSKAHYDRLRIGILFKTNFASKQIVSTASGSN
ncbi:DUF2490 domain-containing protein [Aquimarina sp. RZ0]|uniref:DUF2490 domain-containing protein n=1 Tax=Aquimarina sp. RZ0 TaxID=2607730 RepID=UPI00165F5ED2|nr:DUF2490 domain-containing protein [Aquimarina sp. RZ0]